MADNLSSARDRVAGHRKQIRGSVDKWRTYKETYEKNNQVKTIQNAQGQIDKLIQKHPTLKNERSWEDTWKPTNEPLVNSAANIVKIFSFLTEELWV